MEDPEVLTIKRDETAQDLFRRMDCRPFVLGIPPIDRAAAARPGSTGLVAGDVVEVFGESGSGKTEVRRRRGRPSPAPPLLAPRDARCPHHPGADGRCGPDGSPGGGRRDGPAGGLL